MSSAPRSDDHALLARLASAHDMRAFHELYVRHTPVLFAVAVRLAGNSADAEDAVHDSWMRAVDASARFRGDASVRTWLTGILVNRLRELRRIPTLASLDVMADVVLDPRTIGELQRVDPLDLARALDEMPHGYREIFALHDIEGFTHEEIATTLGIAPGTSKSQLARGRRWLRHALLGTQSDQP